ncbi:MAG: HisA/HisF-related TIM barrel protein [Deltaproteobacteria bacterium]|nr:HisA/HisF-related TIM barrel protein [Deltaproteobacteria bacterium]
MFLIPLIYLKNSEAAHYGGATMPWFQKDPLELAKYFSLQGAQGLYLNDLNIPVTGRGENFQAIESILKNLNLECWITGNFRSLPAIETYISAGADKIVLGASAYQNPAFVKEAALKFPQHIAVLIESKNKKVVVPGLIAPSPKTALDFAKRFEEEGAAAFCYTDEEVPAIGEFCAGVNVPVLNLGDLTTMQDLGSLLPFEKSGLHGVVLSRSLYENRIDLHSAVSYLNDLAAKK